MDRGWVAVRERRSRPRPTRPPPAGTVTVTARLHADQTDPRTGRWSAATGRRSSTPSTPACSGRRPGWTSPPGYLQLEDGAPGVLGPLPVTPSVGGAAPFTNFSYALQWLTFGLIALVALGYFIRLEVLQRRGRPRPPRRAGGPAPGAGRARRRRRAHRRR